VERGKEMKEITIEQLRRALKKDFAELYVEKFTTDWKVQRFFRDIEIGLMPFENTMKLIKG
jgi:hypothetical protein